MYDYFDDYREFQQENEVTDLYELDDFEDDFRDEEDFVDFVPPYSCPHYRQFFPGGGFTPPRPPFGPPGGQPGGPQGGAPSGPPPSFTPSKSQTQGFGGPGGIGIKAVDPGAIRPCRFRFVYIWVRNGNSFWAWLTYVGRRSVSGFRWNGRRWVYFGMDTRRIESFVCY
jgi:hypothetical protein